jgi:hypothetical protein
MSGIPGEKATPGDFWYKGSYVWEAYIDDIKVGETFFYVEDLGQAKPDENLFFDFESAKLFEGDKDGASQPQKKYLSQLSQKDTRYAFIEFNFRNKVNKEYYAEFFFNFCDDDGQVKGSHNYLMFIPPNTMGRCILLLPVGEMMPRVTGLLDRIRCRYSF